MATLAEPEAELVLITQDVTTVNDWPWQIGNEPLPAAGIVVSVCDDAFVT